MPNSVPGPSTGSGQAPGEPHDDSGRSSARTRLAAAREELSAATLRGQAGRDALARYAGAVDDLVAELFTDALGDTPQAVILALGGYGRRHLCLHSDVDLLVLFDGPLSAWHEGALGELLHPLWDLGLAVGHQVRELNDFARIEADNPEFLLALVDARPIAGDRDLFNRFMQRVQRAELRAHVVEALMALTDERHAPFNATFYQLEPDVKEAPGGLRDLAAVRAIARLTDPALLQQGPSDSARLDEAEEFLLRARSILHLDGRRNQNVLSHSLQERVAALLGYPGALPQARVERLMGDYFRHARGIARWLEWVRRVAPLPVGPNLVKAGDGIRFLDSGGAANRPETWLAAFQAAIDAGTAVSDETLASIQQHADRFSGRDFFPDPTRQAAWLEFLKPRPGLYARLSQMHDSGLLARILPEFGPITCRVVRDFYHKYTVDEHTLLAIRTLERLATPAAPGTATTRERERFASLLQDLERPELLVLALLLHDVGKSGDEEHVAESVRLARDVFDRLALPSDAREVVEFLIANHLQMSTVAFRRDTEDPETVRRFAALAGVEERLKMLSLLTFADVDAVSLETLTPWKAELLWRLYVDTYNQLTLGYADELIDQSQSEVAQAVGARHADLQAEEIARFLEGLPQRYLQLFDQEAIARHVRLARDIQPDTVHVSLEPRGSAWELTVVTLDKPFLFSNISGVLASFGMDILRGHAMTSPHGLVLDVFQFTDRERFLELNPGARDEFVAVLEKVVSGLVDVTARLRRREQSPVHLRPRRVTPVVHCDNHASQRYTIVEIVADDALGLLYRISRVMSQQGCDVDLVLMATEGHKAIDVFHITQAGAKLSPAAQEALVASLQRLLEEDHEVA
jgi:[protein-PII] uridylyltransferase